ncbi:MAG: hypothetical protein PQJ58_08255 [Spirochaetales bacterium]|nr:hypothetical protein [Spirochaetales bacterium]
MYVPAKETVRLYLEQMIPKKFLIDSVVEQSTIKLLKKTDLVAIMIKGRTYLPVDIDTSPMDDSKSHKEAAVLTNSLMVITRSIVTSGVKDT